MLISLIHCSHPIRSLFRISWKLLIPPSDPGWLRSREWFSQRPSQLLGLPVVTCTGVAILVEAIPAGGHTLPIPHQQGRLAGGAFQATGTRGALRLAGCSGQGWEKEKGSPD